MSDLLFSLYHVDHRLNQPKFCNVTHTPEALEHYVMNLINLVEEKASHRNFTFASDAMVVHHGIQTFFKDKSFQKLCETVACQLHAQEKIVQEDIKRLGKSVKKGTLVQSLKHGTDSAIYLIAKVESETFLDESDFNIHDGLPFEKLTYRATLIYFSGNTISRTSVYESRSGLTKYWWKDFLGLRELNTNEHNTEKAFKKITSFINRRVNKSTAKADHTYLRNGVNNYFSSRNNFNIDELNEYLLKEYKPINDQIKTDKISSDLLALPQKGRFDSNFEITTELIRKKFRITIPLTDKIDLQLKDAIENLDHIIKAVKVAGEKFVKIRSDSGYDRLVKEKNNDK